MINPGYRKVIAGSDVGYRLGSHVQQADIGSTAHPARQAKAGVDRNLVPVVADADSAAEKEFDFLSNTDIKLAGVLEEEGPLLREEQAKTIEVDLLFVDFDLSEVGIVGSIKCEARRQRVLDIEAELFVVMGAGRQFAAA